MLVFDVINRVYYFAVNKILMLRIAILWKFRGMDESDKSICRYKPFDNDYRS